MGDNKQSLQDKKVVSIEIPETTQKEILKDKDTKEVVGSAVEAILSLQDIFGNNKK